VIAFLFIGAVVVIGGIVFVEQAQRRILVQYPKRQQGNKVFGGESSHLPLKLNTSGVIPPIFASSLLLMPLTIAGFQARRALHPAAKASSTPSACSWAAVSRCTWCCTRC